MNPTSKTRPAAVVPAASPSVRSKRAQWPVPAGLILLSLVPLLQGSLRLAELAGDGPVTPANERFFTSPAPVVVHIVAVTVYCLLGAFQFVPPLRTRRNWHRAAGRILVPAGLLTALSGLWMAAFYVLPPGDGELLLAIRLVVGSAMAACIVLGVLAIRRRDFAAHSEWMTRAYALGLGAGTQVVLLLPAVLLFGPTPELPRAILMGAAWLINLAAAECVIRRRR